MSKTEEYLYKKTKLMRIPINLNNVLEKMKDEFYNNGYNVSWIKIAELSATKLQKDFKTFIIDLEKDFEKDFEKFKKYNEKW